MKTTFREEVLTVVAVTLGHLKGDQHYSFISLYGKASDYTDLYFQRYPQVKVWNETEWEVGSLEHVEEFAEAQLYLDTK